MLKPSLFLPALLLTACAGADAGTGWTTERETLPHGATLVRHTPADLTAATWRLEPDLRIGRVDGVGPDVFGQVADIAVAGDGRPDGLIPVPDHRNTRMSYLHPDSGFVRSHPYTPLMYYQSWDGVVDSAGRAWSGHYLPAATANEDGTRAILGYDPGARWWTPSSGPG